ncbi:DNA primase [Paenibacillus jamilae]|jgi:5S rRNA maturation endonuclease (ribonuclease M5)|uniref:toprim domain-containing protein n=1 Tax=Paenibacillus polymyxa TaxID=1406 RepID=UPI00158010B2|nr:toprim domain-containing protein [Paenibacillus polymyxa]MDP9674828.1 DNA primase [Paenibacillus jamilae]MBY0023803.1 toprim domain-containing protein [Paenibacillus polymyxa]MBY0056475.1 toprim domain-containing protein [Paenibacillus polymyxa]MBY0071822.1 toprim domain-containing protein [Paenibacillus polymyxa]MBY0080612.1 toprim domain-containing protein [Paenibacillus polymyxa]
MAGGYDTLYELIEGYEWVHARWTPDKLIACSPFRDTDDTPSFFVDLRDGPYYGCWFDPGAEDPEWRSGGPAKLVAFLRNIIEEEARELLHDGRDAPADYITLRLHGPTESKRPKPLDSGILADYQRVSSTYLSDRRITNDIQTLFQTGYDPRTRTVTFPWFDAAWRLMNVKYRKVSSKVFYYRKGGAPIRSLIYGIHIINQRKIKRVLLVESETDCLYAWSCGVPAIAVGGSSFTAEKADIIRKSPIEELLLGGDNDRAGRALRAQIRERLASSCALYDVRIPDEYKDINDIPDAETVRAICDGAVRESFCVGMQLPVGKLRRIM